MEKIDVEKPSDYFIGKHISEYGPFVGGKNLRKLLGYSTYESFRQADNRKQLPVKTFNLPKRKGKYALTEDVAKWLYKTVQEVRNMSG